MWHDRTACMVSNRSCFSTMQTRRAVVICDWLFQRRWWRHWRRDFSSWMMRLYDRSWKWCSLHTSTNIVNFASRIPHSHKACTSRHIVAPCRLTCILQQCCHVSLSIGLSYQADDSARSSRVAEKPRDAPYKLERSLRTKPQKVAQLSLFKYGHYKLY